MEKLQRLAGDVDGGDDGGDDGPSRHRRERDREGRVPDPGAGGRLHAGGALLAGLGQGETVAGDRAHDTDAVLDFAEKVSATTVFPSRSGRKSPRSLDRETYGTGYLVERFFSKITEFRTVVTRYDKSARNFLSAVHLAACRFLRRTIENQLHKSTA